MNHIGEISTNKYGEKFKIIKYICSNDVIIQFDDNNYIKHTTYYYFKNGKVCSPYARRTHGVGYLGEGKYTFTDKNNLNSKGHAKKTKCFEYWESMFYRCYNENFQKKTAYLNCTVCDEWHNYQNFAKWFYENYYTIDNEIMNIDKDILIKGNTIYSPNTCCFVPSTINKLFITREKQKKFNTPMGIYKRVNKKDNKAKYDVKLKRYNICVHYGEYDTVEEAFQIYKQEKEKYIKEVADKYKNYLPQKVYNAICSYEVEITD